MPFAGDCGNHDAVRRWDDTSRGVYTLANMIDVNVCGLIESLNRVLWLRETLRAEMQSMVLTSATLEPGTLKSALDIFQKMRDSCTESDLPASKDAILWVQYRMEDESPTISSIYHYCDQIYSAIIMETARFQFLKLKYSEYYSQLDNVERKKMFGERVEQAFPSIVPEIISACNCFALEQWMASVFHSMRILERSLVVMAKKLNVPTDVAEWHNMIEGIEKKARGIDSSYGPDWKEAQKFYAESARHLMFVKDAWRNHIMHVRDEFDEGKALSVLQHTKELTMHLSQRLSEAP